MVEPEISDIKELLERFKVSYPPKNAVDLWVGNVVLVNSGNRATLTIEIAKGWIGFIKKVYIDFRDSTNYKAFINGELYEGNNELEFTIPQQETEKIIIIIENVSALDNSYSFYITGWGEQR